MSVPGGADPTSATAADDDARDVYLEEPGIFSSSDDDDVKKEPPKAPSTTAKAPREEQRTGKQDAAVVDAPAGAASTATAAARNEGKDASAVAAAPVSTAARKEDEAPPNSAGPERKVVWTEEKQESFETHEYTFEVKEHSASACICGNLFAPDSLFCRICGLKRPQEPQEMVTWRRETRRLVQAVSGFEDRIARLEVEMARLSDHFWDFSPLLKVTRSEVDLLQKQVSLLQMSTPDRKEDDVTAVQQASILARERDREREAAANKRMLNSVEEALEKVRKDLRDEVQRVFHSLNAFARSAELDTAEARSEAKRDLDKVLRSIEIKMHDLSTETKKRCDDERRFVEKGLQGLETRIQQLALLVDRKADKNDLVQLSFKVDQKADRADVLRQPVPVMSSPASTEKSVAISQVERVQVSDDLEPLVLELQRQVRELYRWSEMMAELPPEATALRTDLHQLEERLESMIGENETIDAKLKALQPMLLQRLEAKADRDDVNRRLQMLTDYLDQMRKLKVETDSPRMNEELDHLRIQLQSALDAKANTEDTLNALKLLESRNVEVESKVRTECEHIFERVSDYYGHLEDRVALAEKQIRETLMALATKDGTKDRRHDRATCSIPGCVKCGREIHLPPGHRPPRSPSRQKSGDSRSLYRRKDDLETQRLRKKEADLEAAERRRKKEAALEADFETAVQRRRREVDLEVEARRRRNEEADLRAALEANLEAEFERRKKQAELEADHQQRTPGADTEAVLEPDLEPDLEAERTRTRQEQEAERRRMKEADVEAEADRRKEADRKTEVEGSQKTTPHSSRTPSKTPRRTWRR
eukprot:TRINITY_DN17918_c0_g1_i1.p1 TRINITY_DN17918_c0_g1~~TRINITY_DN17918_c0_g1_i1.p1  ORF type:complete len:823 (-),score=194.36 TRINITY_DN17918_c0_g1_i1:165-2633(-)